MRRSRSFRGWSNRDLHYTFPPNNRQNGSAGPQSLPNDYLRDNRGRERALISLDALVFD
jgi:hypothetical protein